MEGAHEAKTTLRQTRYPLDGWSVKELLATFGGGERLKVGRSENETQRQERLERVGRMASQRGVL